MFSCTMQQTFTECEYFSSVNGSGERWLAPTDETARSKPAAYSGKGDDEAVSTNQMQYLAQLPDAEPGMQTCTMYSCNMSYFSVSGHQ